MYFKTTAILIMTENGLIGFCLFSSITYRWSVSNKLPTFAQYRDKETISGRKI